jgi:starch synthase
MTPLRVLSIASEVFPLIKTGGLADVAGALPGALAHEGVEVRTLVPGYPQVLAKLEAPEPVHKYPALFGGPARIIAARATGLDLFVLEAPHLFERPGGPYLGPDGLGWPDNARRFAALARVGADIGKGAIAGFACDVVQAHDWQAALAPAYLHYDSGPRPRTVVTIHNLAFQGHFPAALLTALGLPPHAMSIDGVEYFGGIGFLKSGLLFADKITTVSPSYAREILTPEFGMALDGLLRSRAPDVEGILNGIDDAVWDPAKDPNLPQKYSALRIDARRRNRSALQERLKLTPDPDAPLLGVVSRMTSQKGLDLLLSSLPDVIAEGVQLAILGAGDPELERGFAAAAESHAGSIGCYFGYEEALAHLVQAGSDFLLVPSRFEPCGLTQLCALRYGAAPIVARVGGLADTVVDANEAALSAGVATGIQFYPPTAPELLQAVRRALAIYRDAAAMRRLRLNGMRADVSWRGPAKKYANLFRTLVTEAAK